MKKSVFTLILVLLLSMSVGNAINSQERTNASTCTSPQTCNLYKMMYGQRATVYNALSLSDEQKEDLESVERARFEKLKKLYCELDEEQYILNKMKTGGGYTKSQVIRQQKCVRKISKEIEGINEKYDRNFVKKLSSEQRSKYNNIKRLQNREYKNGLSDSKRQYLNDKKLKTFGEK